MPGRAGERGQASVELLAVLPAAAVLLAACWQGVLAGQAWWLAGQAGRAAARAAVVGGDPLTAARGALPAGAWRRGVVVQRLADGRLRVRLRIPALPGGRSPGRAGMTLGVPG